MVPNGWEHKRLGVVAELQRGFDLPAAKRIDGSVPIISSGGLSGYHNEPKVKAPGIVTGRYGSIGDVFFVENDFWPLNTSLWVKNFHGNEPKYLYYLLTSFDFKKFSDKTGVPGVNRNDLHAVKVGVPPLPEQRKIAQILSTWDRGIATTEKLIDASKQQKKALMQQLLTGKKRLVDPETGKAFEGEWEEVRLIDTVSKEKYSFTGGPFGSDLKSSDYTENGVRIIQLQNIGDGTFHNSYQIFTSQEKADELVSCNIFPDDIIISKMGDPVARATLIPHIHQRYLMASDGIRLAIDKSKYNNRFILETINYREFRNNARAKSTGSTRRRIGLTDLKNIKFRVPELIEQQKIASVLTAADNEVELLEAKLAHLKQEKKALMQQLLTGKRRVNIAETKVATEETLEAEVA
ncbi:TPA: restriction endonuclease subunit S [Photobacterium damselae]